jgi:hypothetical protein
MDINRLWARNISEAQQGTGRQVDVDDAVMRLSRRKPPKTHDSLQVACSEIV